MQCPICHASVRCGPTEGEFSSLSRHMYQEHEDELGVEEHRRWAATSTQSTSPLGITSQHDLDAYCRNLGLIPEATEQASVSIAQKIKHQLDLECLQSEELETRIKKAQRYCSAFSWNDPSYTHYALMLDCLINGGPTDPVNVAAEEFLVKVNEWIDKWRQNKIASFLATLQR